MVVDDDEVVVVSTLWLSLVGGGGTEIIRPRYINRCSVGDNPVMDSILVEREWRGSFGWTWSVKEVDSPVEEEEDDDV